MKYLRPITRDTGAVRAEAEVVHRGRRTATSEARLTSVATGKLLATGTSTCLILERRVGYVSRQMPGTDAKDAVVASYEALNERDIDSAMEALAEDAEWHESEVLPDTGVYRGREAIRAFLTELPRLLGAIPPDRRGGRGRRATGSW